VAGGQWQAADEFQAAVAVGPSKLAFYGIFQEYGTVEHPAQAFGRPAFDGSRDEALQILGEGLWQLLEDATNKTGRFEED
jgi:HK97 gp10 family phage protein